MRANDYAHLRHIYIKLPKRPAPAAELREIRECHDCRPYLKHNLLAALGEPMISLNSENARLLNQLQGDRTPK